MIPQRITTCRTPAIALILVSFLNGCKPEEPRKPKSYRKEGILTRVDTARRRVAMKVRDLKDPARFLDEELDGTVTETTEIWINGRSATLADLREGDKVTAVGYVEGRDKAQRIVAEELRVERPDEPLSEVAASKQPPSARASPAQASPAPARGTPAVLLLLNELKRRRQQAMDARDELLGSGAASDDPEVLKKENTIHRADENIARVEELMAERGLNLDQSIPTTQPAGAPPGSQPQGNAGGDQPGGSN